MKATQIRDLSGAEIEARIKELEEERFRLRFRRATEALCAGARRALAETSLILQRLGGRPPDECA